MKRIARVLAALLLVAAMVACMVPVSAMHQWNMEYFLKKYSDPHFDLAKEPDRAMTVEEFLAVIYAYSYYGDGAAGSAADRDGKAVSPWAAPYVQAEVNKKVVDPAALRWSQTATVAFAAKYLCLAKGKYSYDAVNHYSFTGTQGLSADDLLYLDCAVDWGLISYAPGMDVSKPILRREARKYEVPTGTPVCKTAVTGSTATMRELHAYFTDCYWDLDAGQRQFGLLKNAANDVTMVTFQCAYLNGRPAAGNTWLACDVSHTEAVQNSTAYDRDPQQDAVQWCREHGKLTFLGVSNASDNAFTGDAVTRLLGDRAAMEAAVSEILRAVEQNGLDGVNMGIELYEQYRPLREGYSQFLSLLSTALHQQGKLLMVSCGAYFTDAQEAASFYDYSTIGQVADYVHVIAYDDFNDTGYAYRKTDGAVSDLTRIGRCLRYAAAKMPKEKLLLGFGTFAVDFDKTAVTAVDLGYAEAAKLRANNGAQLQWDSGAAAGYFDYTADGHSHRVWQETPESVAARAKLVSRYDLCGFSYYHLGADAGALLAAGSAHSSYKPELMTAMDAGLLPASLRQKYSAPITRQEFCAMIAAFLLVRPAPAPMGPNVTFTDCQDPNVLQAAALGIVTGYGDGKFKPQNTITRQEAAAMLMRLAKVSGMTAPNDSAVAFSELAAMQSWAKDGVAFVSACTDPVSGKRVMGGTGQNRFSPLGFYTREQSVMTMIRLYHAIAAK